MEFYTAYNRPKTQATPSGIKEEPVYQMQIDNKGNKNLVQTGMTNIYDIIQESLEQSKIENIIRRAREGDPYALETMNGQFIDATDLPTSLAEAQSFVIKAKNEFDQLPIEIRRQFDMSAEKYVATYGTEAWMNIMIPKNSTDNTKNLTQPSTQPPTKPSKNNTDSTNKGEEK